MRIVMVAALIGACGGEAPVPEEECLMRLGGEYDVTYVDGGAPACEGMDGPFGLPIGVRPTVACMFEVDSAGDWRCPTSEMRTIDDACGFTLAATEPLTDMGPGDIGFTYTLDSTGPASATGEIPAAVHLVASEPWAMLTWDCTREVRLVPR